MESCCSWFFEARNGPPMKIFQPIFRQITPVVKDHIKEVYLLLCCALITSVVGVCFDLLWNIGGILTTLGYIVSIICLSMIPSHEQEKRVALLMIAALCEGASIGSFFHLVTRMLGQGDLIFIKAHDLKLMKAFVGTEIAFCCYFGAATYVTRHKYLYLGGRLQSGLYILIWLHLATLILKESAISNFDQYFLGLLVPMGNIEVEVLRIMDRAQVGDLDHVTNVLTLKNLILGFYFSLMGLFYY